MEGVAGVRTALETSHYRIVASKDINDFTFSFVAPLEAEYYIKFHFWYMLFC